MYVSFGKNVDITLRLLLRYRLRPRIKQPYNNFM